MSLSAEELDAISNTLRLSSYSGLKFIENGKVERLVADLRAARAENENLRAALDAIVADAWEASGGTVDWGYVVNEPLVDAARDLLAAAVGLEEETE